MSRNTANNGRYTVAWGKDHACGWFVQVFDLHSEDKEIPVVDKDTLFDGLTFDDLLAVADQYDVGEIVRYEMFGSF